MALAYSLDQATRPARAQSVSHLDLRNELCLELVSLILRLSPRVVPIDRVQVLHEVWELVLLENLFEPHVEAERPLRLMPKNDGSQQIVRDVPCSS